MATLVLLHVDGVHALPHHQLERVVARYPRLHPQRCSLRQSILLPEGAVPTSCQPRWAPNRR
jgi:hypothetical protein